MGAIHWDFASASGNYFRIVNRSVKNWELDIGMVVGFITTAIAVHKTCKNSVRQTLETKARSSQPDGVLESDD